MRIRLIHEGPAFFKRMLVLFLGAICCLYAVPSRAQNYQPYPVGERAVGLGGAFIALSDDSSGCYYNPAGIVFADSNRVSVAGTIYGFSLFEMSDLNAFSGDIQKAETANFFASPTTLAMLMRFSDLGSEASPKNAVGFVIITPDYRSNSISTEFSGMDVVYNYRESGQTYWFGPSYARRISQRLSLGGSVYGLFEQEHAAGTIVGRLEGFRYNGEMTTPDVSYTFEESNKSLNLLMQAGMQARFDLLHIGLVVRTPSVQAWGQGTQTTGFLIATDDDADLESRETDYRPNRHDPFMVGLGFALEQPLLYAVSLDVRLHGNDLYKNKDNGEIAETVDLKSVINANIGGEYVIAGKVPLRAGFFTDFSPMEINTTKEQAQLDSYGTTFSATLLHKNTSFTAGIVYSWGQGEQYLVKNQETADGSGDGVPTKTTLSLQTLNFVLATSFRFGYADK